MKNTLAMRVSMALIVAITLVLAGVVAASAIPDRYGGASFAIPYAPYTAGPVVHPSDEPYAPYTAGPVVREEKRPYAPYTAGPVVGEQTKTPDRIGNYLRK